LWVHKVMSCILHRHSPDAASDDDNLAGIGDFLKRVAGSTGRIEAKP
jgi:hypothetical protein